MTRGSKSDKTLVIPPKKWRSAASLRGYAGAIRAALNEAERELALGGAYPVHLELKTAKALLEIVCQAIHTEQGHGP